MSDREVVSGKMAATREADLLDAAAKTAEAEHSLHLLVAARKVQLRHS